MKAKVLITQSSDSETPWTVAHQASLFMEFSRQEYWSGLHTLLQGTFLTQGSSPCSYISCIGRQVLYHYCYLESLTCTRHMTNCSKWKNEWSFSSCFFTRSVSCSLKTKDHQEDLLMTHNLDIVARENTSFTKVLSEPQSLKLGYGTVSILRAWTEWF